jgi:hypothetical protein
MYGEISLFLKDHLHWLLAAACLYFAYGGIVLRQMDCSAPYPWGYFSERKAFHGPQAAFVGVLYLVVAALALFNPWLGIAGVVAVSLLAWMIGLSRPSM